MPSHRRRLAHYSRYFGVFRRVGTVPGPVGDIVCPPLRTNAGFPNPIRGIAVAVPLQMRRPILLFALMLTMGAASAEALSVRDIVELSKSGLGDELLLALIDVEKKVFPVDTATLKTLKDAGVSERVILAMIRSGRLPEPVPVPEPPAAQYVPPPAPAPQVVVIEHREPEASRVREVAVPVPYYIPVYVRPHPPVLPQPHYPIDAFVPRASIGLPHPRLGLSPAPPRPTSDPPYWK